MEKLAATVRVSGKGGDWGFHEWFALGRRASCCADRKPREVFHRNRGVHLDLTWINNSQNRIVR